MTGALVKDSQNRDPFDVWVILLAEAVIVHINLHTEVGDIPSRNINTSITLGPISTHWLRAKKKERGYIRKAISAINTIVFLIVNVALLPTYNVSAPINAILNAIFIASLHRVKRDFIAHAL